MPLRDRRRGRADAAAARGGALRPDFRSLETSEPASSIPSDWGTQFRALGRALQSWFAESPERAPTDEVAGLAETVPSDEVTERPFGNELAELLSQPTSAPANESVGEQCCVVTPSRETFERVVPLTRMPLRPQTGAITWPQLLDAANANPSIAERRALLRQAAREPEARLEAALLAAYREEDAEGRLLALQALLSGRFASAPALFADALRIGNDDERSFAVDALFACGDREALTAALSDRLEAVAARAALAYVATSTRADYVRTLAPLVDGSRLDTILSLLAGVLE